MKNQNKKSKKTKYSPGKLLSKKDLGKISGGKGKGKGEIVSSDSY